jgi:hypothetical protein
MGMCRFGFPFEGNPSREEKKTRLVAAVAEAVDICGENGQISGYDRFWPAPWK